ncbi:unnamed protein product [Spirodela intermedia]|uniref:Delta(3)-Delta(2)-enoyl-CoA isomerase n=1 Tax=Spirodela intermedia TaxID=51605 RepID=A0A7I8IVX2_SPIIN|nr:unnamed protein product [Spirodela intermedia]CAA6661147.1 unnamed protein product [Spirodela intermedia]
MVTLEKRGRVYLLTLTGDGEHRLNPALIGDLHSALSQIRAEASATGGVGGAALVIAAEGRFFSNGFDLKWASEKSPDSHRRSRLMTSAFQRTLAALISLPMPTVAAVTGHAAAAGFFLVLAHDYALMRADRGFLYMSEVDRGLPIIDAVMSLARAKMAPRARREALLGGAKLTAAAAAERGIVDGVCGGAAETVAAAVRLGEELAGLTWDGPSYAAARIAVFPEFAKIVELAAEEDPKSKL